MRDNPERGELEPANDVRMRCKNSPSKSICNSPLVVVVLPDNPFRGMGVWRNFTETKQSGHTPRSGPEVKNGRSSVKDGAPERLRCGTSISIAHNYKQHHSLCRAAAVCIEVSRLSERAVEEPMTTCETTEVNCLQRVAPDLMRSWCSRSSSLIEKPAVKTEIPSKIWFWQLWSGKLSRSALAALLWNLKNKILLDRKHKTCL